MIYISSESQYVTFY